MTRKLHYAVALAVLSVTAGSEAGTWTGSGANWSTVGTPGWDTLPDAVGATANIAAATGNIIVDAPYTIGTIIAGGSYGGKTLGTTGGTSALTFAVSTGQALLDATNNGSDANGSTVTVNSALVLNSTLEVRNAVSSGSQNVILTGAVTGAGGLNLTNTAASPVGGGERFALQNTGNTFAGGISIGQGVSLRATGTGTLGTGSITVATPATGQLSSIDFRNDTGNLTQSYSNNINFGTAPSGGGNVLTLNNAALNVTLNGVLSGTMGNTNRTNLSGGTLQLGGASANTWTGQLRTGTNSTIILNKVSALNNGLSMRGQSDGTSTLLSGVTDTLTGQISSDGNDSGGGSAYLAKIGLKDGNNGTFTINNGSKINLVNTWGIGGTGTSSTTTSLNLHSGNGTGTLAVTTEIGTNPGFARNISITGTGTVNLNRGLGNTYEGSTTVNGGTLLLSNTSGSATSSGAVIVNSGATLGGTGFVDTGTTNNGVTLNAGGKLSPGASAGVLTMTTLGSGVFNITGAVTANNSQSMIYELDSLAGPNDRLDILAAASSLNIGSAVLEFNDFKFTNLGGLQDGVYTLFDTNNAIIGSLGAVTSGGIDANYNGALSFADSGKDLVLTVSSVPEPTSLAILGGLGAMAIKRRRRA